MFPSMFQYNSPSIQNNSLYMSHNNCLYMPLHTPNCILMEFSQKP